MLIVTIVYRVLNFVVQSIIQPRFIGAAVELSVTVTFLALVFWARLLGPGRSDPGHSARALGEGPSRRSASARTMDRCAVAGIGQGAGPGGAFETAAPPTSRHDCDRFDVGGRSEVGSVDAVAEEAPIMGREHGEPATAHTELCVYRPHVALHGVDRHRQVDGDLVER